MSKTESNVYGVKPVSLIPVILNLNENAKQFEFRFSNTEQSEICSLRDLVQPKYKLSLQAYSDDILNLGRFANAKLLRFSYTERLSLLVSANSKSRSIILVQLIAPLIYIVHL